MMHENHILRPWNVDTPLKLHCIAEEENKNNEHDIHAPSLERLLYTLVEDAKLNQINRTYRSVRDQYNALTQSTKSYRLDTHVSLNHLFWTYPQAALCAQSKLKWRAGQFKKPIRPHGVAVIVVDSIKENTLFCKTRSKTFRFYLSGDLNYHSKQIEIKRAPYLVIFTITNSLKNPGVYNPCHAFAIPVLSKECFFPVENNYERDVLKTFTHWLPLWQKKGLNVTIEKPLFGETVMNNDNNKPEFIRPDVLIKTPKENYCLEIITSHQDNYIAQKARKYQLMSKNLKVFNFDGVGSEKKGCFDKALNDTFCQISTYLFNK